MADVVWISLKHTGTHSEPCKEDLDYNWREAAMGVRPAIGDLPPRGYIIVNNGYLDFCGETIFDQSMRYGDMYCTADGKGEWGQAKVPDDIEAFYFKVGEICFRLLSSNFKDAEHVFMEGLQLGSRYPGISAQERVDEMISCANRLGVRVEKQRRMAVLHELDGI